PVRGRVAVVTGASSGIGRATAAELAAPRELSGIGRATAAELARRGARVLAVARREAELASLAQDSGLEYLAESVATAEGCARVVEEAHRRLGPIELLVLNAARLSYHDRPIWEQTPEGWRDTLDLNLD